jgi:hypothetical protein
MNDMPGATKTPERLKPSEVMWTAALVVIGAALVVGVLAVYLVKTHGVLLSKDGDKEYADTLVLAVVGTGVLLIICGAFYGRIREITIPGGAGLKLAAPETLASAVDSAVEKRAQGVRDPHVRAKLKDEAQVHANALFAQQYWGCPPKPPDETVDEIAQSAAEAVMIMRRIGTSPPSARNETGGG